MLHVPRTVTQHQKDNGTETSEPIEALRGRHAYVLLGDPGIGKSTAFEMEAAAANVKLIKAHDFITLDGEADNRAGKTIFIDGLDETRAGNINGRTPLDAIRRQLDRIGRPAFRISCRAADWLGASDQNSLQMLMPSGEKLGVFHLDPLTESDVVVMLDKNHGVPDPQAFMRDAERHRLDDLLNNPQTLQLLAQAVGKDGNWPTTRRETYEMACQKLAAEPNEEHQAAKLSSSVNTHGLFDAVGYLCVLHLISDVQSFSRINIDGLLPLGLDEIKNPETLPLRAALATRLFRGIGNGSFAPVHRSIAEFLAARFISVKIAQTIPMGRVLALICGADGSIVTELRAFASWLAVFSPEFREIQIEDDPLGILLYGDAKNFPNAEKKRILSAIKDKGDSALGFNWRDWHWHSFEALATPDMAAEFKRILGVLPSTLGDRLIANCVVQALYGGDAIMSMGPLLLSAVRETCFEDGVRKTALRAYLKKYSIELNLALALLEDVRVGNTKDDDDELLGILLQHLYPMHIEPEKLVTYFHPNKRQSFFGMYERFWRSDFLAKTPNDHLRRLLDAFRAMGPFQWHKDWQELWTILSALLARTIEQHGDTVNNATLYEWLGVVLDERESNHADQKSRERINAWFRSRPERYKAVLLVALERITDNDRFRSRIWSRLGGVSSPTDIGVWWLQQAESAKTSERAKIYFNNAFAVGEDGILYGGIPLKGLEEWVHARPQFASELTNRLCCNLLDEQGEDVWQIDDVKRNHRYDTEKRSRVESFRADLDKMRNNTAHSQLIYYFALAYQDALTDAHGDTPEHRLAHFLNDDAELVEAAFSALEAALTRADLPSIREILESDSNGKIFHLTPALLVGMELAHKKNPGRILQLNDELLMKALVSRYVYAAGEEPDWFNLLLEKKPALLAEACVMYMQARLKSKKEHIHGIYALANDDKYETVAKMVVPAVLTGFPHRARLTQLSALEYLLKAALLYMGKAELNSLIHSRLQLKSVDVAQRIYLLSAGVILNAHQYLDALTKYVAGKEIRVGHLGAFFHREQGESSKLGDLSIHTRARLIEIVAQSCKPDRHADGWVTAALNRADLVRNWIHALATSPDPTATQSLQRLTTLPEMHQWFEQLGQARLQQSTVARDFSFLHPSHAQVADTLYQGLPANAAGVAAIVNEVLAGIGRDIGTSDLNLYRQFWNVDSYDRPQTPKPEEACRDTLANLMRERLRKFQIECTVEAQHANEKRSDILCTFSTWAIPIELKKDNHDALWRGITEQLLVKYSIDPRAQGHGAYVALWFGGGFKKNPPSTGRKPATAAQLLERLKEQVPTERSKLISIHVIDCRSV